MQGGIRLRNLPYKEVATRKVVGFITMKPKLDISVPIAAQVAQIALFEKLQEGFNLHPAGMLRKLQQKAKSEGGDVGTMCSRFHIRTREIALESLGRVEAGLRAEVTFSRTYYGDDLELIKYFNLDPEVLTRDIERWTKKEGIDAVKLVKWIIKVLPDILLWAFSETSRILAQEEAKKNSQDE